MQVCCSFFDIHQSLRWSVTFASFSDLFRCHSKTAKTASQKKPAFSYAYSSAAISGTIAKSLYLIHRDGKGDTGRDLSAMLAFLSCRNSKHISRRSRSFLYPFCSTLQRSAELYYKEQRRRTLTYIRDPISFYQQENT